MLSIKREYVKEEEGNSERAFFDRNSLNYHALRVKIFGRIRRRGMLKKAGTFVVGSLHDCTNATNKPSPTETRTWFEIGTLM